MSRRQIIKILSFFPALGLFARLVSARESNSATTPAAGGKPANLMAEDEPLAKAMKYKHDATQVKGIRTNQQAICSNCNRWNKCNETDKACQTGKNDNAEYNPCNLFPGKVVANKGWCLSWQAKG